MRRLRHLLIAAPIAAVLAAAGAPPAGASSGGDAPDGGFVTIADQCGAYIYNYQWWGAQYVYEYEQYGYETPYAAYAYGRVGYYGNLINYYNC